MGTVLGLSLTATDIVWALVDPSEGTVLDHDALELHAHTELAGTAARSAHAIARACGFEVDRIRLTWTPDAARNGLRLRSQLGAMDFEVEAVPLACATRVLVRPEHADMPPLVALAYGAALAHVDPAEAITVPVRRQSPAPRRRRAGRLLAGALGVAAAAAVAAVFLTAGSVPQVGPAASAAEQAVAPDPGWVSVTAPSDGAAEPLRKVVTESTESTESMEFAGSSDSVEPAQSWQSTVVADPVPEPAAEPHLPAAGQEHLPGAQPLQAPLPGPADPVPAAAEPLPGPEMTVPVNLFSALP